MRCAAALTLCPFSKQVSAEAAAKQAHAARLRQVGRGGLNEEGAEEGAAGAATRRAEIVADTTIVQRPSEVERALAHLAQLLARAARGGGAVAAGDGGGGGGGGGDGAGPSSAPQLAAAWPAPRLAALAEQAKGHLERLEAQRKLFIQARALLARVWGGPPQAAAGTTAARRRATRSLRLFHSQPTSAPRPLLSPTTPSRRVRCRWRSAACCTPTTSCRWLRCARRCGAPASA